MTLKRIDRRSFLRAIALSLTSVGLSGSIASAAGRALPPSGAESLGEPFDPFACSIREPSPFTDAARSRYDRVVTGRIHGFTVPRGERWRVKGLVRSDRNVVVKGTLVMRPGDTLRFVDVKEASFVGGGMKPKASDVGLWVMGVGVLDAVGTQTLTWARASDSIALGADTVTLDADPTGWTPGDRVIIAPTSAPSLPNYWKHQDDLVIQSVAGRVVTFTSPTVRAHPSCTLPNGRVMTAEVVNLTRDVRIGGTASGRSHIFLRSSVAQTIKYVEFEHLSPLKKNKFVPGRWGLHFHHAMNGAIGSLIEGCSMHDVGGRAMVAHASNGTTWRDCAVHNLSKGDGFWWDTDTEADKSFDTLWDRCLVSKAKGNAFLFAGGSGNVARDCVAFGSFGSALTVAAFNWPSSLGQPADFNAFGCVAHNTYTDRGHGTAVRLWQNATIQLIEDFISYRNGHAGRNGAYANESTWNRLICAENAMPFELHALGSHFNDCIWHGSGGQYAVVTAKHVLNAESTLTNCTFLGSTTACLRLNGEDNPDRLQLVNCTFSGNEFWMEPDVPAESSVGVSDASHGDITLLRLGEEGILNPAWNAMVRSP